jgi:hypothetical protein
LFHLRAASNWGYAMGQSSDVFSARMAAFLRAIEHVGSES